MRVKVTYGSRHSLPRLAHPVRLALAGAASPRAACWRPLPRWRCPPLRTAPPVRRPAAARRGEEGGGVAQRRGATNRDATKRRATEKCIRVLQRERRPAVAGWACGVTGLRVTRERLWWGEARAARRRRRWCSPAASATAPSAVAFPPTPIDDETELIAPAHLRGGREEQGAVRGVRRRERESSAARPSAAPAFEGRGGAQRGDVVVVGDGRAQPHVGGGGAEGGLVDARVVPE